MEIQDFLRSFLSYYLIIPAAVLCIIPMRNQSVFGLKKTLAITCLILFPLISVLALIDVWLGLFYNEPFFILTVIVCFIIYSFVCKTNFYKRIHIFILSCAITSFIANISNCFDAWLHPDSNIDAFSIEAAVFQTVLSTFIMLLLAYPFYRFATRLIDNFNVSRVWYAGTVTSFLFLLLNILFIPKDYSGVSRNITFFLTILVILLFLYIFLAIMYYDMVKTIKDSDEDDFKNQLLRMQENVYKQQTEYLMETSRQRHDFKNMIKTFNMLAQNNSFDELKIYIQEYADNLPQNDSKLYTLNTPLNALLNHYRNEAQKSDIKLSCEVDVPSVIPISNLDLCAIIGNILENALSACKNIGAKDQRFIDLSVTYENDSAVYISGTNSFNDKDIIPGNKRSKGLGLASIKSLAKKYNGSANFSYEKNEYYSEIMLRNPPKTKE